jgi:hypothetical protein
VNQDQAVQEYRDACAHERRALSAVADTREKQILANTAHAQASNTLVAAIERRERAEDALAGAKPAAPEAAAIDYPGVKLPDQLRQAVVESGGRTYFSNSVPQSDGDDKTAEERAKRDEVEALSRQNGSLTADERVLNGGGSMVADPAQLGMG